MIPAKQEERGTVYTFYSFKGGVGRSMALANAAALLAKWGYSVLVVDWDLEAPGIERFFTHDNPEIQESRATKPGIVDLVQAQSDGKPLQWRDCSIDVNIRGNASRLSLLTAGRGGEDYTSRLHALNFPPRRKNLWVIYRFSGRADRGIDEAYGMWNQRTAAVALS